MKRINHIIFWLMVLGLSVYAFIRVNDTGRTLPRTSWPEAHPSAQTWDQVLAHPANVSVRVLETGTLRAKLAGLVNLKHPAARALLNQERDVPVKAYLFTHPARGVYLIDAGFDRAYSERPNGSIRGLSAPFVPRARQIPGTDPGSRLAAEGTTLTGFFFTHLHFDHLAGAKDFPLGDMTLAAGKDEPYLNIRYIIAGEHLAHAKQLQEFNFSHGVPMPPLGPALDVFGDGSLWAISTPGHTRGHVSYLVNAQSGAVLITGDACNLKEQLTLGAGPGFFSSDAKLAQSSFMAIKAFHETHPQVRLELGHDR